MMYQAKEILETILWYILPSLDSIRYNGIMAYYCDYDSFNNIIHDHIIKLIVVLVLIAVVFFLSLASKYRNVE